jgi:hypothetical protein
MASQKDMSSTKLNQDKHQRENTIHLLILKQLYATREKEVAREREGVTEPLPKEMMSLDESDESDDKPIMRIRPKKLHGGQRCNDFLSENEDAEDEVNLADLTANANDFSLLTDKNQSTN